MKIRAAVVESAGCADFVSVGCDDIVEPKKAHWPRSIILDERVEPTSGVTGWTA